MNEQRRRFIAFQASSKYLMGHVAGVMDMVQDTLTSDGETLDEESLIAIETQVKSIAAELIHQVQAQPVGVLLTKKASPLYMQRQRELDDER